MSSSLDFLRYIYLLYMARVASTEVVITKPKRGRAQRNIVDKRERVIDNTYFFLSTGLMKEDGTVKIESNRPWSAVCSDEWFRISKSNGESREEINVSIDANVHNDQREGYITFKNNKGKEIYLRIVQDNVNEYIFELETFPVECEVLWQNGCIGKIAKVYTKDEECTLGYTIKCNGYASYNGEITIYEDEPHIVKTIHLNELTNHFTYKVNLLPREAEIMWSNGSNDKMTYTDCVEDSYALSYTANCEGFSIEEGKMTASINQPNQVKNIVLQQGGNDFYFTLYTEPQKCTVIWSSGDIGKNVHVLSNKDTVTLFYYVVCEGYEVYHGCMTCHKGQNASDKITLITKE